MDAMPVRSVDSIERGINGVLFRSRAQTAGGRVGFGLDLDYITKLCVPYVHSHLVQDLNISIFHWRPLKLVLPNGTRYNQFWVRGVVCEVGLNLKGAL
jgi:hypothetical protein